MLPLRSSPITGKSNHDGTADTEGRKSGQIRYITREGEVYPSSNSTSCLFIAAAKPVDEHDDAQLRDRGDGNTEEHTAT